MSENEVREFQVLQERLNVAAICDVLDSLGYRHQAMSSRLRPLLPDIRKCGFAGRARTFQWAETDHIDENDPYGLELEAMDSLESGDVVVQSIEAGVDCTPWGELMTTVAMKNGSVGCICDGNIRDCVQVIQMGFPVYFVGIHPLDSKGRGIVKAYDVPVRCGDVSVRRGELIFADYDGIVVVPREVEKEALKLAAEKLGKENDARRDLKSGKTLRETYDIHKVL